MNSRISPSLAVLLTLGVALLVATVDSSHDSSSPESGPPGKRPSERPGQLALTKSDDGMALAQFGFDEDEPIRIEARGNKFRWVFRYPGPDHQLATEDDIVSANQLHLPAGVAVKLVLQSDDFLYFLYCPSMDLRGMAMPGLTDSLLIRAGVEQVGKHPLITDPMCGYSPLHDDQMGSIQIQTRAEFVHWWASLPDLIPAKHSRDPSGP